MIELKEIPVSSIIYGIRFREDLGDISDLVASFKKEGVISPLAVKGNPDGTYLLLAGGRRYTAAMKAGLSTVPVRCYPDSISEQEMRSIELMENICRKDLDWAEKAKLSKRIWELQVEIHGEKASTASDASGVSKRDVAGMIGKSHASLIKDIQRAEALTFFPEISKAKNASEADKMIGKLQEEMIRAELASRIAKKVADTPVDKLHQTLVNQYIVGDFFSGITKVPSGSVDLIELDPPYGIELTSQKRDMGTIYTDQYNEVDVADYPDFLFNLVKECYRVMSSSSWLIFWHAKQWRETIKNILDDYVDMVAEEAIWYKGNVGQANNPSLYLASCFEPFLYIRKGNPSIIRQGRSNVFYYKPVPSSRKVHPTERPIEMIQEILQTFCWEGSRIAVPFLGSGNTLLAASNLSLTAFGWDLSQAYKDAYIIKVTNSRPGSYHSYKEEQDG